MPSPTNAVLVQFEGNLIPVACFDPQCGSGDACELSSDFESCRLPARASILDVDGTAWSAQKVTRSFCLRGNRGDPDWQAPPTETVTGYHVDGPAMLAQVAVGSPFTLASASARAPADETTEALDEDANVVQVVSLDFDGDAAIDKAVLFEPAVEAGDDDGPDRSLVIMLAKGTAREPIYDVHEIVGVSDIDRDGAEELIVVHRLRDIHGSSFGMVGVRVQVSGVASCDSVPLDTTAAIGSDAELERPGL